MCKLFVNCIVTFNLFKREDSVLVEGLNRKYISKVVKSIARKK